MRATCTETRRTIRNWAKSRRIIAYFIDKDDSSPAAHFEVRQPYLTSTDAEPRVRLVEQGWSVGLDRLRKREIMRELELDAPLYHGTPITLLARLKRDGRLRLVS